MENIQDIYPLSPMQEGMLFHSIYSPESEIYKEQFSCRLLGTLDKNVFKSAWEKVIERHDILRTAFVWEEVDEPLQIVQKEIELPFEYIDLSTENDKKNRIDELVKLNHKERFDFSKAPLMKISLIKLNENEHFLIWDHHHILFDGWALPVLMQEFMNIYTAIMNNEEIILPDAYPYKNYISWLKSQDEEKTEKFWRERLKEFRIPTKLKMPFENKPVKGYFKKSIFLPETLTNKLAKVNRVEKITINTFAQAAWTILLSYYTGVDDVAFGATMSGRNADIHGIGNMVGLFINTLPVRTTIDKSKKIIDWLKEFQITQSKLQEYEYSPLFKVQTWSEIPKGESLFNTILVFENYPMNEAAKEMDEILHIEDVQSIERTNYPLTLVISPDKKIGVEIAYDTEEFDEFAISQILDKYEFVLNYLLENPGNLIAQVKFLSENEKRLIKNLAFGTRKREHPYKNIINWFEYIAKNKLDQIAVVDDQNSLTYDELNSKANQVANYLIERSIGPECIVGICLDRSIDMITALLGINKIGAAFLPIDSNYPVERIKYIVEDSRLDLLISYEEILKDLDEKDNIYIELKKFKYESSSYSQANPGTNISELNSSYLIYTSGSTGKPKAVCLTQKGLCNFVNDAIYDFNYGADEKILQFSSFGFDAAVGEIYTSLLSGGTLYIPDREITLSEKDLAEYINKNRITVAHLTPSYLSVVDPENFSKDLKIVCVGDRCPSTLAEKWGKDFVFFNGYGPTEVTIGATLLKYQKPYYSLNSFPIGKGFGNVRVYILDENLNLVAIGVKGEIYIGGDGVARGYLNRPDLTSEKFIPDLYSDDSGGRMYRTGDLARYLPDGNIEFIGRRDHQIKLRGFRIELSEIDAVIQEHEFVKDSVVIGIKEEKGNEFLAAYIIKGNPELTKEEILDYLKKSLPDYMMPKTITFLKEFPLTSSNKIDRQKLPWPDKSEISDIYVLPHTATEEIIANIWSDILKVEKVSRYSNFFELGGHSLLATQLISRLRETFKKEITFQMVFKSDSLKSLGMAIDNENISKEDQGQILTVSRDQKIPLSFSQQRLWFLDQLNPDDPSYNIPTILRLKGKLNIELVEKALNLIIEKYEILRTSFQISGGKPYQKIHESFQLKVEQISANGYSIEDKLISARELITRKSTIPFKLDELPLIRCEKIEIEPDDNILIFLLHHIITDGWSLSLIVNDFIELYSSFNNRKDPKLNKLEIQFADYAAWQQDQFISETYIGELNYWKNQLKDIPPLLELPYDKPKPGVQTTSCGKVDVKLEQPIVKELNAIARSENSTLFMVLLAAFQLLLSRYSNMKDIVTGIPIAGRNNKQLEKLVGFFVNNLAIRTIIDEHETFRDLLVNVRDTTLRAYENQSLPFDKLVEELKPLRDLSHQPIFQVMFVFQNLPSVSGKIGELEMLPFETNTQTINYQLTITLQENDEGIEGAIEYNSDLFNEDTIERFAGHYRILLREVAEHTDASLSDIQYLSDYERTKVLKEWNDRKKYIIDENVVERFERTAGQFSKSEALVYKTISSFDTPIILTYEELNSKVNKLAHYLLSQDIKTEDIIAICMHRNVDMIISMLAILKSGCAFLPIDPSLPMERIEYMLKTSGCTKIIMNYSTENVVEDLDIHKINLDDSKNIIAEKAEENIELEIELDNLAYVIFTSGSTGMPKGVMLTHKGLSNLSIVQKEAFSISNDKKIMQFSSLSFDASVWETVMALLNGGSLYLTSQNIISSGYDLSEYIKENKITTITLPPSVLAVLPENEYSDLKTLITAGEAISNETVRKWNKTRTYFNAYGPTETTVCATMLSPEKEYPKGPPIGRSIDNFETYILNEYFYPVGIGIPGELCVGGIGLARGYINQPDLTSDKFIPHLFTDKKGERLYRTGDLVRYLPDGNIEFIGRVDTQIKLRGFRIETGEIEHNLKRMDIIKDSAVTLKKLSNSQEKLIGYVVCREEDFNKESIIKNLREKLPEYMIPASLIRIDKMPLTTSGKVDKNKLPLPDFTREELDIEYVAPRNEGEEKLVKIVEELLSVKNVGIKDNFFQLGGHSLLATQFVSRIKEEFNKEIRLIKIFEEPTIEGVFKNLENSGSDQTIEKPAIQKISRESRRTKRSDIH